MIETFRVPGSCGMIELRGVRLGPYFAHTTLPEDDGPRPRRLTHLPSGCTVGGAVMTLAHARRLAEWLTANATHLRRTDPSVVAGAIAKAVGVDGFGGRFDGSGCSAANAALVEIARGSRK